MKYWEIELEGTDKVGKDTILKYLEILGNYKYSINSRGLLSQLVYNNKFNRNYDYKIYKNNLHKVIILLYAEDEDLEIRCKITNEPKYDIKSDKNLFNTISQVLKYNNFIVLKYNTSLKTPYLIAKDIIRKMEELNNE